MTRFLGYYCHGFVVPLVELIVYVENVLFCLNA